MNALLIIAWIALSVAVAILAERKGRSFELFLNVSLLFSPVVGFSIALALPATEKALIEGGHAKRCPQCRRLMETDIRNCPFCGQKQPPERIRVDRESSTWVWLGGWVGVALIAVGFLGLIGIAVEWMRRHSF